MRSLFVVSASGLVLFSRHFTSTPPSSLIGALLRGISELAERTVGALSFIEYATSCVAIARGGARGAGVFSVLVYDRDLRATSSAVYRRANEVFGAILTRLFLKAFLEEFGADLAASQYGHALSAYKAFGPKAFSCVREAIRLCVQQLAVGGRFTGADFLLPSSDGFEGPGLSVVPGIEAIYLLGDDGLTETWASASSTSSALAVNANANANPTMVMPSPAAGAQAQMPGAPTGNVPSLPSAAIPGLALGPGAAAAAGPRGGGIGGGIGGGGINDQLLLLLSTNVRPLLDAMSACLSLYNEDSTPYHASMTTDKGSRVMLYRLGEATLTLLVRTEVGEDDIQRSSEVLLAVLQRLLGLFLRLKRGAGGASLAGLSLGGVGLAGASGGMSGGNAAAIWPSSLVSVAGSSSSGDMGMGMGAGGMQDGAGGASAITSSVSSTGPFEALIGPSALAAAMGTADPDFLDISSSATSLSAGSSGAAGVGASGNLARDLSAR